MKILTTIAIIILTFSLHAQTFDKIVSHKYGNGNEKLNMTDSKGQKQGLWVYYRMYFNTLSSALSTEESDTSFRQVSKGQYRDNKKIGKWEYFDDGGCYFTTTKTETYHENGSVTAITHADLVVTNYNIDSSIVVSTIRALDKDTVQIRCTQGICIAKYNSNELVKFEFDDLDFEQYRIAFGIYHREIERLKN